MAGSESHHQLPLPRFDAAPKLLVVVAPYYRDIADDLIAGARATLEAAGAGHELVEVPGALEVPSAIAADDTAQRHEPVEIGLPERRGETTHYETVCNDSSNGLMLLGLQGACVGNGILTVDHRDQAWARAKVSGKNKGGGAAEAALTMIETRRRFGLDRCCPLYTFPSPRDRQKSRRPSSA